MLPNLVDLCLNSVTTNLRKHNLLFTTSDDFYTKRKLEFLQKKYSPDLISRLDAEKVGLPEEFLDIVVNRYTKFLDTRWFKKCPLDKLTSKLAEIGCNLEKIVCHCRYQCSKDGFPEAISDSICHLINLKSFTFHLMCDDWILKNVAKFCPHIEEIDVTDSPITSEGVRYLCRDKNGKLLCTVLKKLCFGESEYINNKDVEYLLQNLPSLEITDHPLLPWALHSLHKENLPSLDKVAPYNITTLDLTPRYIIKSSYFADVVKVCVSVCPWLKIFSYAFRKEAQLSYLLNLPDLEQLYISNVVRSEINLDSFLTSKGSRLTFLSIENCTVSVSVLAEKCPCLKELILFEATVLCDEDSKPVFNLLSSLTFFKYENLNSMSAEGMKRMLSSSSFVQLESLSFKHCNLESPELKGAILKCCELYPIKNMAFYITLIKKEFIKGILRTCRTLGYLTLADRGYYEGTEDVLCFAELLPNKPKISIGDLYQWHNGGGHFKNY